MPFGLPTPWSFHRFSLWRTLPSSSNPSQHPTPPHTCCSLTRPHSGLPPPSRSTARVPTLWSLAPEYFLLFLASCQHSQLHSLPPQLIKAFPPNKIMSSLKINSLQVRELCSTPSTSPHTHIHTLQPLAEPRDTNFHDKPLIKKKSKVKKAAATHWALVSGLWHYRATVMQEEHFLQWIKIS